MRNDGKKMHIAVHDLPKLQGSIRRAKGSGPFSADRCWKPAHFSTSWARGRPGTPLLWGISSDNESNGPDPLLGLEKLGKEPTLGAVGVGRCVGPITEQRQGQLREDLVADVTGVK